MKSSIAITLIVAGAAVVALPVVSTAWRVYLQTQAITHGASLAPWEGEIGDLYRIGCWLLGAAMIGVGVVSSFAPAMQARSHPLPAHAG
ncbi:MAG: hypothetical protein ACTHN5_11630 [Phycisphaerae bacterium]